MSETPAIYNPQVGRGVPAEPHPQPLPLVSTIRWTRVGDGLPAFGHTVAVWLNDLGIVIRAYRDGRTATVWRVAGTDGPPIDDYLVTAWAELPDGALPPPDGGVV